MYKAVGWDVSSLFADAIQMGEKDHRQSLLWLVVRFQATEELAWRT